MKNNNKKERLRLKKMTADELEILLEEETSKPMAEMDADLIGEISTALIKARGIVYEEPDVRESFHKFIVKYGDELKKHDDTEFYYFIGKYSDRIKEYERECRKDKWKKRVKKAIRSKWTAAAAAFLIAIGIGNTYTVSAHGENVFSYVVKFTKGGVTVDLSDDGRIVLPTAEDDPYGMLKKCKEIGIETDLPYYIPSEFVLKEMNSVNNEGIKYIFFRFENKKQFITITIRNIPVDDAVLGIASEKHNITNIEINGKDAVLSQEDNQSNLIFKSGDFMVDIFTQDVDYTICDDIFKSIK